MLSGKLRKGAIGAISDQQRPLDGRQKVLLHVVEVAREVGAQKVDQRRCRKVADAPGIGSDHVQCITEPKDATILGVEVVERRYQQFQRNRGNCERAQLRRGGLRRSEEHTSELQSLMRISYAVFCLTKNKKTTNNH